MINQIGLGEQKFLARLGVADIPRKILLVGAVFVSSNLRWKRLGEIGRQRSLCCGVAGFHQRILDFQTDPGLIEIGLRIDGDLAHRSRCRQPHLPAAFLAELNRFCTGCNDQRIIHNLVGAAFGGDGINAVSRSQIASSGGAVQTGHQLRDPRLRLILLDELIQHALDLIPAAGIGLQRFEIVDVHELGLLPDW